MSDTKAMGKFFETYRIKAGLTLAAAAEILDIGGADILARYEAGKTLIPLNEVFSMANIYNIPPDRVVQMFYDLSFERAQKQARESDSDSHLIKSER
ncbi:MAG TPA: helix-turn-helix transcriptional regulator [Bdellovibrionales bacterium]|nr:helix-turn-helix transcriptional regulator [Bdellovibrionales bacterium]